MELQEANEPGHATRAKAMWGEGLGHVVVIHILVRQALQTLANRAFLPVLVAGQTLLPHKFLCFHTCRYTCRCTCHYTRRHACRHTSRDTCRYTCNRSCCLCCCRNCCHTCCFTCGHTCFNVSKPA